MFNKVFFIFILQGFKRKTLAVTVDGRLPEDVTAKDIVLAVIAKIGTAGGQGYVIEFRGTAIQALSRWKLE